MLTVLNNKLKALFRNEEGFAIAVTILVWPLMLLAVSGIFVTGESIRRKMVLQNAADAAVHAGAMVQADTLSRIAVINRMMAWTYLQANKMEMDYTVANWALLADEVMEDLKAPLQTANRAASITCPHPEHKVARTAALPVVWGWFSGVEQTPYCPNQIALNKHNEEQQTIETLGSLKAQLANRLEGAYGNISSMNKAIDDLSAKSAARVEKTVRAVFAENAKEFGDSSSLYVRSDVTGSCLVPMKDENAFLDLAGTAQKNALLNTPGISWWRPDGSRSEGFRRQYDTNSNGLSALFSIGFKGWMMNLTGTCAPYLSASADVKVSGDGRVITEGFTLAGSNFSLPDELTALSIYTRSRSTLGFNENVRALPRQLSEKFLSDGALVVGAKLPYANPLAAIFGELSGKWFDAHTLPAKMDLWCISAARACAATPDGRYSRTKFENYSPGTTDYTAVMLPIAMAGNNAAEVVRDVHSKLKPGGWSVLDNWSLLNKFASKGE